MTPELVVEIGRRAVQTALMVAAPMLLAGLLIGLLISIFQAATQINEQTLTFIPKIVAVMLALVIFAPWIIQMMTTFAADLLQQMAQVGG